MTPMDKKEYLSRYHNLQLRIGKKNEYIAFCRERADSIPGPSYGEKIGSNPNRNTEAPFEKWIIRALDAEDELKDLEEKAKLAKQEIETVISKLEDETLQMILVYRYIDWMTWSEIAAKVYYSDKTIRRKHDLAIDMLKIDQL